MTDNPVGIRQSATIVFPDYSDRKSSEKEKSSGNAAQLHRKTLLIILQC